ncbi:serine protease [Luminiphilus syltensis NOR5-1B]|uniref:Serine protease n=1 Tax=Luminiphilus syltensis NOR5-1B TaxID=565045 RepID=B8KXB7_9GAMM|nr:S8 family serine peptidase [Luminiphilus syltensis]EED34650.1 serine protease [Luminiphilus syltensis NOR5-1B]
MMTLPVNSTPAAPRWKVIPLFACAVWLFSQASYSQELTVGGYADFGDDVDEQVEEQVADQLEEQTEQGVADATEDEVSDGVVDSVEDRVEDQLTVGGYVDFDEQVEEQVEDQVEDSVSDEVVDGVVDQAEDAVLDDITEGAEEEIVVTTEEVIAEEVEDSLETSVEQSVEEDTEEEVVATVEEQAAESAEQQIEEQVADAAEDAVAGDVTAATEVAVEESAGDAAEASLEEQVAESISADAEEEVIDDVYDTAERVALVSTEDLLASEVEELIDDIETGIGIDKHRIHSDQWLVMAEPEVFDELADEGYLFDTFTELPGLGLRLAEVAAPASFDISVARDGILDVVGDRAEVDLNHIYTAGVPDAGDAASGVLPRDAMTFPDDIGSLNLRIGVVDSAVDMTHPALAKASITARAFVGNDTDMPAFHGTAIASIFSADFEDFQGIAPGATLYSAAVFESSENDGEIASTVSLVRAIDWLLATGVDVVNLSLAGPANRLLEVALKRVAERDVIVLAAAGNGGPMSRPLYPAAYDSVVAVTAVDREGRVFRLANRGDYLDLAAPGVNLRHALAGGGYATSSGTSFAVPFAATAAAAIKHREPETDVLDRLYASVTDLGPPGRDTIYGYGLLRP